ncbi:MAG TPA: IPT/TIG domain-containing protein, partial [Anaeromyxobacteraceae bacterium]
MRPTAPLALAAAAALQAACVRNVELPAETGVPTVTDFSPSAAYAGELLAVRGSGFDGAPQRNRVEFASGATATGTELRSGALIVRVPRGAGSGAIAVSNARGPSAPAGSFTYLGGGDLAFGRVVRSRVLLHVPTGIASTTDDLFIQSQLWGGLVSMLDKHFEGDGASQAISVGGGAALVWIDAAAGTVVRRVVATGATTSAAYGGQSYARLCSVQAAGGRPELVAEVTWAPAPRPGCPGCGAIELTTLDAATMAVVDPTRTLTLDDFWAVQDGGAGRIALLGVRAGAGGDLPGTGGLYLVVPGVPVDLWVPEPAANPLGRLARQPLAVGQLPSLHHVAAFLDVFGDVVTIDLDPPSGTPAFEAGAIGLHALIEFASGFAASGKWLVASKRTENLILGVDLDARAIAWSVSTGAPGPATGDGSLFKVASLASNDALEIEAATGVVLARRDLGLFPGRNIVHGGLAWCPAVDCGSPKLRVHTEYPVGSLVTTPDESQVAGTGTTDATALGVAWD